MTYVIGGDVRQSKLTAKRKEEIIRLLSLGATDKDVCAAVGIAERTFYVWLQDGRESKSEAKVQFLQDVTRAKADARLVAIDSLRLGMLPSVVKSDSTETVRETRLNKNGNPYTYEKVISRRVLTEQPGDWRAAESFLKRRDPDNWSEKLVIGLTPEDREVFAALNLEPSEAVQQWLNMMRELAARKVGHDNPI